MKEELERYNDYKCQLKVLEKELRKEQNKEAKISGSNFEINGDIRPKGYMSNNIENQIINKTDRIEEIEEKIADLKSRIEIIDYALKTLKNNDRIAIQMRFFDKLSYDTIANTLNLSDRKAAQKKVTIAIENIEKVLLDFQLCYNVCS